MRMKHAYGTILLASVLNLSVLVLAFASSSTDQIQIKYERQHVFENGRQKFVVTMTNSSKELFKGELDVTAVDVMDKRVDADTILFHDGLPPDGSQQAAILWLKEPERIVSLKFGISGKFQAIPAQGIDVQYEELGRRPGMNSMSVFIYTTAKDRKSLQKIVDVYKARYSTLYGFQIQFFNDRKKAARDLPMDDAALSCQIASYWLNKGTKYERLTINE